MYKENKIRIKDLRLDKCPSLRELYLFKVMHEPRDCSRLTWPDKQRDGEYCLTVRTDSLSRVAEWRLHFTMRESSAQIWSAITNDVLQVCKAIASQGGSNVVALQTQDRNANNAGSQTVVPIREMNNSLNTDKNSGTESADALKSLFRTVGEEPRRRGSDARDIDAHKINTQLCDSGDRETTVLTYPSLLYFLGKEYDRDSITPTPFSLVLLSACLIDEAAGGVTTSMNLAQTAEIIHRLGLTKRPTDLIALYRMDVLALILPDTNRVGAEAFMRRALSRLYATPLPAQPHSAVPLFAVAASCVPDDCGEVAGLLSKAESSLLETSRTRLPIVAHSKYGNNSVPSSIHAVPQMAAAV